MRPSERVDLEEDLFLTVRELMERFDVPAISIKRMINKAVRGLPWSTELRERVEGEDPTF